LTVYQQAVTVIPVTRGSKGGCVGILALALVAGFVLAPVAGADLRPGSRHSFLVGKHGRLALPLPLPLSPPKLTGDKRGVAHVLACVRYEVANWGAQRGTGPGRGAVGRGGSARVNAAARRDRALVTVIVAKRLLTTGPDPAKPLYRRTFVDTGGLNRQHVVRCYTFQLPKAISRFLISHGAFARAASRRRSGRRLLWIDVQQDRDFKYVDGRYDWREGTAVGAGDRTAPRPSLAAHAAAGTSNPYGTLSVTNNTAAGVYCQGSSCPLVNSSTGLPGTISGTSNSSTYGIPLAVAGDAVQCFDQGSNGSDPAGFANYNSAGDPQPYNAGTVSAASGGSGVTLLPNTTGTTVTEGLAADYSLAWAGNQQTAGTSGFISGTAKLGLQAIKAGLGGMVSPGAIVTGILGIFEYFLENSCKESGNYFNVTSTETNGAAASTTINAQTANFEIAAHTGSTPPGLQVNPSSIAPPSGSGSALWLNNDVAINTGFSDNICECSQSVGNNAIYMNWQAYNPCGSAGFGNNPAECSLSPPQTPLVTSGTGSINCGQANTGCPFPQADWPATNGRQLIYAGLGGGSSGVLWGCDPFFMFNCQSAYLDSGNNITALAFNGSNTIYMGDSNASLFTCSPSTSGGCTESITLGSHNGITALAYGNNTVYAGVYTGGGINNGELNRCSVSTHGSLGCSLTYTFPNGAKVTGLVYANGVISAGVNNGVLYNCTQSNGSCTPDFTFPKGDDVESLTAAYGQLWAGLSNGTLWTCTIGGTSCSPWDTLSTGAAITSLTPGPNNTVYLGAPVTNNPTAVGVWQCGTGGSNDCNGVTATGTVASLVYANNYLYYGTSDGANLEQCNPNPTAVAPCTQLDYGSVSNQGINAMLAAPPG
jgi:hypothetical protein